MKKKIAPTQENRRQLRKKLSAALVMLLIASLLMTTTSFAWLVMSTAPEVTGITTNIGANGSLEIVLLTTETRSDLSSIRAAVGTTLAQGNRAANNAWGNLVDLTYPEYGLGSILLMPARLNLFSSGDGYYVDTGLLSVPTYSFDGRIEKLTDDTVSAIYGGDKFSMVLGSQDYGVRAIGTTNSLSVQGSALAMAKSNIVTYTNSALSNTTSIMNTRGDTLFSIVLTHSMDATKTYGDTELEELKSMLVDMDTVASYIDLALRQGAVAVAASNIGNPDTFSAVKDTLMDTSKELSAILNEVENAGTFSEEYLSWVEALDDIQNDLNAANTACAQLTGGTYTWQEFRTILDYLMNMDALYINGTLFANFDTSTASSLIGSDVELTLAPGSGIFADIANFVGNFRSLLTYMGTNITITTASTVNPAYLNALSDSVEDLEPAEYESGEEEGEEGEAGEEGEENAQPPVDLTAIYGYALDFAFRCNASVSDLLLQTTPTQRVYDQSESGNTMGGGSYMEFSTMDSGYTLDQRVQLMDAIRVAFLDDQNKILGVGKLNTSNYTTEDGVMKAPLYLYDFSIDPEDGAMIMGERRKTDNVLTPLVQNVATAVTVVVWLDGDIVDNTMVSATEAASLSGTLNLQFASSADLVPATERDLLSVTANLTDLQTLLEEKLETLEAGQGTYTTASWEAFITAYNYAKTVSENVNTSDLQVYHASVNLTKAFQALEVVSQETIAARVAEMRAELGTTADIARYVIVGEDGGYIAAGGDSHTQEEHDSWNIVEILYSVNHNNNLHDEGNNIFTPIYSEESWLTLADALYRAEAVVLNSKSTDAQLDNALTALNNAYDNLERMVFYSPYEYNGQLYYEAICDAANTDTYGKWYDSDFKRVVADITVLNLDAYAEPTDVAYISQDNTVSNHLDYISPTLVFHDSVYPSLEDEEFRGVNWSITNLDPAPEVPEETTDPDEPAETTPSPDIIGGEMMTWRQHHRIQYLIEQAEFYGIEPDTGDAEALLITSTWTDYTGETHHTYGLRQDVTAAEADAAIAKLEADMAQLLSIEYVHGSVYQKLAVAADKARAIEGFEETEPTETEPEGTEPEETEPAPDLTNLRICVADVDWLLGEAATPQKVCDVLRRINQYYTHIVNLRDSSDDPDVLADQIEAVADQDDYGYATFSQLMLLQTVVENVSDMATAEDAPEDLQTAYQEAVRLCNYNIGDGDDETVFNGDIVLLNINEELVKLGETEVTDENAVPDHIHGDTDIFKINYPSKYPDLPLSLTGKTGNVRLTAQVLTQSGIVNTVSMDLYVYTKPYGGSNGVDINGTKLDINYDLTIDVGETAKLDADLRDFNYCQAGDFPTDMDLQKQVALGNLIYKDVDLYGMPYVRYEPVHPAHPDTYSWSTANTDLVSITNKDAYSCTVEGKKPGTTTISVLLVTEEGDQVTETINVTVREP